jgi:uroporphyrinogen III methyltransferase/synthase
LGTRGSALALAQARLAADAIGGDVEIVVVQTRGDRERELIDKAKWTAELERALLDGSVDVAVHSAKDVPGELADGTLLAGVLAREDPRDVLVGAAGLQALAPGARVGTAALRRAAQLRAVRPDLDIVELRGNVDTRLGKLAAGEVDALVLAAAGLARLGRTEESAALDGVPAAGQGIVVLQARAGRRRLAAAVGRACLRRGARCRLPQRRRCACGDGRGRAHADAARLGRRGRRVGVDRRRPVRPGSRGARPRCRDPDARGRRGRADRRGSRRVSAAQPGTAYLVGAGPGDPGLLTARALELLRTADVVLHDKLIAIEILDGVRDDAIVENVGKIGGGEQVAQEFTTARLVEHAQAGRSVVRLKGGDPFVFGRGGEEAQACVTAGVPFEVVPGVTAGVAAAAYAGIPVTQRGLAPAVAFVTGHEDPAKPETQIDWPALAAFPGTLVFYMGVRQLPQIAAQLIAAGRAADEPAAIVQRGTFGDQVSVGGPLEQLPAIAASAAIRAPAITIVGPVAALRDELAWVAAARPLGGISVAVTRARKQASALATRLRELGARVVEAPTIRTVPVDFALPEDLGDALVFTSPSGVEQVLAAVHDARALSGPQIVAIGPGTATALRAGGIAADIVPERSSSEGVIAALEELSPRRVVVVRAVEGRELLLETLRAGGVDVELVAPYRTQALVLDAELRDAALTCDYALFASGSSVRSLHTASGGSLTGPRIISIGPATSAVLRELGAEPAAEADPHTPAGLIAALLADAAARPR